MDKKKPHHSPEFLGRTLVVFGVRQLLISLYTPLENVRFELSQTSQLEQELYISDCRLRLRL